MKVLHISNKPVFPLIDGGCHAMNGLLECLIHLNYSVDHICISTQKHPFNPSAYPSNFKVTAVEIDTTLNAVDALKSLLKGKSYNLSRFKTKEFEKVLVNSILSNEYDLILFDSIYSAVFINEIKQITTAKLVIRTHNVEFKIWSELSQKARNPLKKWYLNKLSQSLLKAEQQILSSADGILTISEDDLKLFHTMKISSPMKSISVPLQTTPYKTDYTNSSFYFIGSMNWEPNIDALRYLLDSIWPEIKTQLPYAQLIIVGSFMEKVRVESTMDIHVKGFVEDLDQVYFNEGILLCPIRLGSGVRIKVLEAMSKGAPIVSSEKGVEGIPSINDCIAVTTGNEGFIRAAVALHADPERRKILGENARNYIQNNYSITKIAEQLDGFLRAL